MPAFNAAAFISRAVDSVLAQTYADFEVIVVDDGSSDDTRTIAAAYGGRVRLIAQPNRGPAGARNRGLQEARGRYVAFLDCDDYWLPGKLDRQVALLDAQPQVGFCSTMTAIVDMQGRPVADWACRCPGDELLATLFVDSAAISGSTSGVLARRELIGAVGGFDETLRGFEDPDLWIRLAARTRYACIAEALTVVTRTSGSVSAQLRPMRAATLASFRKNRRLLPAARRGAFWRAACAGALTDYAKTAWRAGDRGCALRWTAEALLRSPLGRGRLALGLLVAMLSGQRF